MHRFLTGSASSSPVTCSTCRKHTLKRFLQYRMPNGCSTFSTIRSGRSLFTAAGTKNVAASTLRASTIGVTSVVIGSCVFHILNENGLLSNVPAPALQQNLVSRQSGQETSNGSSRAIASNASADSPESSIPEEEKQEEESAWKEFTRRLEVIESVADRITDFVIPDWARGISQSIGKLQKELSMAPGSLADEIWQEAHDPYINPEIEQRATVRVSKELCEEERAFLAKRRKVTATALGRYLRISEQDVHPDDVPTIAIVGSGGGLRACVAGAGSMLACSEAGLFDCVTYTAGVSGSCWLQAIFHSSLGQHSFEKVLAHLKNRIGVHIAYPPPAFRQLNSAPTNKFLLSGFVEKMRGDSKAELGLVDAYGLLLAARLLVPKGELGVNDRDLKISNQGDYIQRGEAPMPIYTAVRHEIPILEKSSEVEKSTGSPSEETKEKAQQESWFQWFEITPYELFCEEWSAGIKTWAMGRKFVDGQDMPQDDEGLRVPELRMPLLLGIFGSAFCATLSHYYKEIRPIVKGLTGFASIDDMIEGRNNDLKLVHPIDPASIPNFAFGMKGKLADETPPEIYNNEHLQLMDAGMSNNLPIYPLLRPGREVDIIIAFDASADIKTENWLSVADGYAKQRGIKGWPIGVGWPKTTDTMTKTIGQLEDAQVQSAIEAEDKIEQARVEQIRHAKEDNREDVHMKASDRMNDDPGDLGYCTVWVGTTQERQHHDANAKTPTSKVGAEDWQLMEPDAGITVVYFPFLSNPNVKGVDPVTSPFMSTWNFIYTPEDIDKVIALARANFDEGCEQTQKTIRAVYERKKANRQARESAAKLERWRRKVRLGIVGKKGEGDHFS